jgi:hypothetical protein
MSDFIFKSFKPDMTNTLLPHSTGLHYSLRTLAPCMPALQLLDITTVYPGECQSRNVPDKYSFCNRYTADEVWTELLHSAVHLL